MKYSYFPGCSLHSTGIEFGLSTEAVFDHLGLELIELQDWNCCGASSAHALDHTLSVCLPARNLAIAQEAGYDLVAPCAACFNRMKNCDYILRDDPEICAKVESVVGFHFEGNIAIRPLPGVLFEDCGVEVIKTQVKQPLNGLKVVPYYGCLLVRPPKIVQFDHAENPQILTRLLQAAGAQVMDWSYATECCGGSLSLSRSGLVRNMVSRLVEHAREAGAEALVTACPLCQINLEMRQVVNPMMPAFYFTELLGLAFGLGEASKWWRKHLIDPRPLLQNAGLG